MRKKILRIRFRKRDLIQLDELAKRIGVPSRSRLVNIALQILLDSCSGGLPDLGRKHPVKIRLDPALQERLDEVSRLLQTPKTELTRIALTEFAHRNRTVVQESGEL